MSHSNQADRALLQVLDEARNEPGPELDWADIERRLERKLRVAALPERAASLRTRWVFAFAAAGALALSIGLLSNDEHAPTRAPESAAHTVRDGDALPPHARLSADSSDLSFEHAGRSAWTLEHGGVATLEASGGVVIVRLERGSVRAKVTPSDRPETFVVEAGDARVAVHGTEFRVALAGDHVAVSVSEGSVLVGSRESPGAGERLSAPASSRFTLSGRPASADPGKVPARTPQGSRPVAPAPPASAQPESNLVLEPSILEVDRGVGQAFDLAAACFRRHTPSSDGVRVTANTTLTLRALPDGRLELVGFNPPLAPTAQSCVRDGMSALSIAASERGITVSRRVELER